MKPFDLTRKAQNDLQSIAIFTEEQWGVTQRNAYVKQFDDTFHLLATNPSVGKACDEVRSGYRKFPQGSHLVFYKEGSNTVIEIVRILHKSMDVPAQFQMPDLI